MPQFPLTRRCLLSGLGASGLALILPLPVRAASAAKPLVQVVKDPSCGCCGAWIEIMAQEGFEMQVFEASYEDLAALKQQSGISEDMASCHTARVGNYLLEGHVPPALVHQLLQEAPEALGLAVPGMPMGSPGMGPESEREAYDVYLMYSDGRSEVYAHFEAA